jgi:Cytochrome c3/Cytochrome c554 and c-prime
MMQWQATIPACWWLPAAITVCIGGLAQCVGGDSVSRPAAVVNALGEEYTGSAACSHCHGSISNNYAHTAHAWTSRPAEKQFIKGSFQPGQNIFSFNDYNNLPVSVQVVMDARDSGLYQTAYINGMPRRTERFGVVIGSGRKAQSYLYWRGNQLLQLPVSWFSATDSWAGSPGFPTDQVKFNRLIPAHCMECHSTMCNLLPTTETIPGPNPPAFFDRQRMIYGIGCENCHGPGARHVAYESQHPEDKGGHYIVNPAMLSRQQKLDVCAACHSGIRTSLQPAFSFVPGDTLSNYYGPGPPADSAHAEVHGNQYGLLAASKCFRMSGTLECRSCHESHVESGRDLAVYSQRCMSCHQPGAMSGAHAQAPWCSRKPDRGEDITRNCIDCHMPVRASSLVTLMVPGKKELAPLLVRSHLIAVYAGAKQR